MLKKLIHLFFIFLPLLSHSQDAFVIGEFSVKKILDGDTFLLESLDKPARLIGIDTEEKFRDPDAVKKVNEISSNWAEYYAHKRDSSQKPAKVESPFGYYTWQWTKHLFSDVVKVRLEADDLTKSVDKYGRYLVYIIAEKNDGTEFNYNIECVKQGYSPYFIKYGYVKRFDMEFKQAQEYAISQKLGIWSGKELCYPDYTERIEWWGKRAEQIKTYENNFAGKPGYYSLINTNDFGKLKDQIEDTVTVFGFVSSINKEKNPHIIKLETGDKDYLELVFFGQNYHIINDLDLENPMDYYIYVKGKLSEYNGKLQIIIDDVSQIWSS